MALAPPPGPYLSRETTVTPDYGVAVDNTDDGQVYTRRLFDQTYYNIAANWFCANDDDANLLLTWLDTNLGVDVSLTIRDAVYTCKVIPGTVRSWPSASNVSTIRAQLRGTKNG